MSLVEDKATLKERAHGWFVMQSYSKCSPQPYLVAGFTRAKKEKYLHLGILPSILHLPPWKRTQSTTLCRLCGEAKEDVLHILCICKRLDKEKRNIKTCPKWNTDKDMQTGSESMLRRRGYPASLSSGSIHVCSRNKAKHQHLADPSDINPRSLLLLKRSTSSGI